VSSASPDSGHHFSGRKTGSGSFVPKETLFSTTKHPTNTFKMPINQPINPLNPKNSLNH